MYILKIIFLLIAILLSLLLLFQKLFIKKIKNNVIVSHYVAFMTGILFLYVINAIAMTIFVDGIFNRIIMLFFALSPFIIGYFATYKKEKIFSFMQLFCVILSIVYICY